MAEKEMKKLNSEELKEVSGGERYNDEKPVPAYQIGDWVRVRRMYVGYITDMRLLRFSGPWEYTVFDDLSTSTRCREEEMEPWSKGK